LCPWAACSSRGLHTRSQLAWGSSKNNCHQCHVNTLPPLGAYTRSLGMGEQRDVEVLKRIAEKEYHMGNRLDQ